MLDSFVNLKDAKKLAREWASKLTSIDAPWSIIAEEIAWGLQEVERGGHPNIVLKSVIERIHARKTPPCPS